MKERISRFAALTIAALALASSAIGIFNGFTYDDRYIVEMNPAMRTLSRWWMTFATSYWPTNWGGDGYRPLTILLFKIQYALGGGSPMAFHAVNILLYAAVSLLVLALARRVLPLRAAWLVAALFAVHPVHVEAVANVVGQSELWVAAFVLAALVLYLRDRQSGPVRPWTATLILACYALGCFAKEHAIVLPALLVAAECTVLDSGGGLVALRRQRETRLLYLGLVLVAIAFVGVRGAVLSDHGLGGFTPYTPFSSLHISPIQRILTAVGVVPQWLRLFYFPARLTPEWGPPEIPIAQGLAIWQLPGFLLLAAVLVFGVVLRRRMPVASFGIAVMVFALLPSSNFIVPAGIILAERTLFLPSVGAMLVVGGVVHRIARWRHVMSPRTSAAVLCAITVVLAAGIGRSVTRTPVWHDNDRLFQQAVRDVPDSYRAHFMLGAWHFENRQIQKGEAEYRRALALFPYDPAVSYNMADQYRRLGMCKPAVPLYRWTLELEPDFPYGRAAYAECLVETGDYPEARRYAYKAISVGGNRALSRRIVFVADSLETLAHGAVTAVGASGKVR